MTGKDKKLTDFTFIRTKKNRNEMNETKWPYNFDVNLYLAIKDN